MDAQNRMDAAELAQVEAWKSHRWTQDRKCPICGNIAWQTNPRIAYFTNEQTPIDGSAYPVVLIYCSVCSYTIQIGAVTTGIRKPGVKGSLK